MMIDLDSGALFSATSASWSADTEIQKSWMQTNGVDALGVIPNVNGLVCPDLKAVKVPSEKWTNDSAAEVAAIAAQASRKDTALLSADESLPFTWVFQTREGGVGILQITGFTGNLSGVKIRYKLVLNALPAKKP